MIDRIYIDEAIRIRKDFLENLSKVNEFEEYYNTLLEEFNKLQTDIDVIEDNKDTIKYTEEDIRILVEGLNNNIEGVLNKMIPYTEKANKLDEEQHLLYMSIKEKYPNITDRELYDELIPYISKVDEDFEI